MNRIPESFKSPKSHFRRISNKPYSRMIYINVCPNEFCHLWVLALQELELAGALAEIKKAFSQRLSRLDTR